MKSTTLRWMTLLGLFAGLVAAPAAALAAAATDASANPPAASSELKQKDAAPAKPVNVNTATRQELEKVPRIGRKIAERIIAGRPYKSLDELKKIEGLGDKTFEAAKPYLTVE